MAVCTKISTAVRTVKYGAVIAVVSSLLGGLPGVAPSLSAGYLIADSYGRAKTSVNSLSLPEKMFKYSVIGLGMLSVALSESAQVVGGFLLSFLLVFGFARMRHAPNSPRIDETR